MKPGVEILLLVQGFLSGQDQSLSAVNRIERLLHEYFPESAATEELEEALSLYRPGCVLPYYDVPEMIDSLRGAERSLSELRFSHEGDE
ncbi:hypothetical protein OIE63_11810 [Streptomyces sp. NBC_01795]|uniref:hypothetical protein n=1 Tax=unclassified Streptomyces TaxID=2593676 RepID=UPI002DDB62A0|nr:MULTISPECIES: hypothetical protein [unclassified Streptomyces]WSA92178.1 hypothetical protein OIE63_11810 [Streptomyces sp. NBC_01795]WSB76544.1 hypothetical protein OHB04_12605 [Streptomyces sp. NBC_01775]WSS15168.1 hypothetical protein OG533_27250 [Streptomyces sp. NBC_01186]